MSTILYYFCFSVHFFSIHPKVTSNYIAPKISKNNVGKKAYNVLYSDIRTYVNGYFIPSYNIDGKTIINIKSLASLGYINWYESSRVITLTISGLETNASTSNIYQNKPFENYRRYLSMTEYEVRRLFPEFQYDMNWLGSDWYYRENDCFYCVAFADGKCSAVEITLEEAYPAIANYVNGNGDISSKDFESFIGIKTEFVYFPDEFSSPYLLYYYDGYEIWVFCDNYGNINILNSCIISK